MAGYGCDTEPGWAMTHDEFVTLIYNEMLETSLIFVERADFEKEMAGWKFDPVMNGEELRAVVMTKGPELHFVTFTKQVISLAEIKKYFDPLLAEFGCVKTKTPAGDVRQKRFNRKIGFVEEPSDDPYFIHYTLSAFRARYKGEVRCQL